MLIPKLEKTGLIWGLAGFIFGAALSGTAVGALGHSASTLLSPPSDKPQVQAPVGNADASLVLPQRVIVSVVKSDEVEAAINDIPVGVRPKVRADVAGGKYRLVWLTAWDWDKSEGQVGNTISILTGDYRRFVMLNERRTRIAIPEPKSGSIEMRGEVSEDGNIAVSILSGTQPIALPQMSPGQSITIQVIARDPVEFLANGKATTSPRAVPPTED
jgi:hypothetical protein